MLVLANQLGSQPSLAFMRVALDQKGAAAVTMSRACRRRSRPSCPFCYRLHACKIAHGSAQGAPQAGRSGSQGSGPAHSIGLRHRQNRRWRQRRHANPTHRQAAPPHCSALRAAGSIAMTSLACLATPWGQVGGAPCRRQASARPAAAQALTSSRISGVTSTGTLAAAIWADRRRPPPAAATAAHSPQTTHCWPPQPGTLPLSTSVGHRRSMRIAAAAGEDIVPRGPEQQFFQAVRPSCLSSAACMLPWQQLLC